MNAILLLHAGSTWGMVGLIWFVQLVHYPLLVYVGADRFVAYEREHCRRTSWVVGPLMLVELATAAWLALDPPTGKAPVIAWLGVGLVAALWLCTATVQVPLHNRLSQAYDESAAARLARTNWFRTAASTARGAIALYLLADWSSR